MFLLYTRDGLLSRKIEGTGKVACGGCPMAAREKNTRYTAETNCVRPLAFTPYGSFTTTMVGETFGLPRANTVRPYEMDDSQNVFTMPGERSSPLRGNVAFEEKRPPYGG